MNTVIFYIKSTIYFSFYISVSLQQMKYGMRKHIVFNYCLKTVLGMYIACRDPSIITLNTIVGTLAVRVHVHDLIWAKQQRTGNIPTDK